MPVQLPSSLRSFRTEIVRSPCGDRPSHGARAGIVQFHLRHVYGLRSYDLSKFVKLLAKPNRRGCGARESVQKSHSRLLPPQGGLAEAAQKGGYGQDTGSVDPSQAKCELGIRKWKDTWYDWSRKTATKNTTYNACYASKLQENVKEGLFFQNIPKPKNHPCWPRSPIFSHSSKLGYASFCWFCDAGSHIWLKKN